MPRWIGVALAAITLMFSVRPLAQPSARVFSLARESASIKARTVSAEDLVGLHDLGVASISPDGGAAAFEVRTADPVRNTYCIQMFVLRIRGPHVLTKVDDGGELITLKFSNYGLLEYPAGSPLSSTPQWSPDGRSIAYLKRVGGTVQLWQAFADGSGAASIAQSDVDIVSFSWMPRSNLLVFASRPGLKKFGDDVQNEGLRGFLYDDRFAPSITRQPMPREIPLTYKVVDRGDGSIREATAEEATFIKPLPPSSISNADLWASLLGDRTAWSTRPSSPRGQSRLLATVGGKSFSCDDAACRSGIFGLWWSADGDEVRFLRREGWARSQTAFYRWNPHNQRPSRLWVTDNVVENCSPADDDLICNFEAPTIPRRLVRLSGRSGVLRTLFDANPQLSAINLQPARRLHWRNNLGLEVFGDLVLPRDYQAGRRYPLLIVGYVSRGFLRGGVGDEYPIQLFADNGYAVLSFNRPIDFGDIAASGNLEQDLKAGLTDWADRRSVNSALEAGIDLVLGMGVADPNRIGLTGLSDGSSTVQWALINSSRYAAASVSSLNGQSSYLAVSGPARAAIFRRRGLLGITDRGAAESWRQASLESGAETVNLPILVQTSDDELVGGLESYQALKELRRPVEMHVFPQEHHIKWQPVHRLAVYRRNLQWFDFWMSGKDDPDPVDPGQYVRWRSLKRDQVQLARRAP